MSNESTPSRLGRGLGSMVNEVSTIKAGSTPTGGGFLRIPLNDIRESGAGRQPDQALIQSIKKFGVLQPVLVAKTDAGYDLLAGSRRLRAARVAGLADIPALIIPPDRAGSLDVYLEENLNRSDIDETDRIRLRDRWMRETGQDLELAEQRIPETQWEDMAASPSKPSLKWMIAGGVMAAASIIMITFILTTKHDRKKLAAKATVEAVKETIEIPPPPMVDNSWMDQFRFPGSARLIESDHLSLIFAKPMFSQSSLTPVGLLYLNQLAAIVISSDQPLTIEIIGYGADASPTQPPFTLGLSRAQIAAEHLRSEGISENRISIRGASNVPDEIGYEQTVKIILRK